MSYRPLLLSLLVAPLFVAACDGYEPVLTDEYFPYGNQRTAGSGVAYVLAKMMPEKELKLEAVQETQQIIQEIPGPPAPAPAPAPEPEAAPEPMEETPMEEVFQDAQQK